MNSAKNEYVLFGDESDWLVNEHGTFLIEFHVSGTIYVYEKRCIISRMKKRQLRKPLILCMI